MSTNTLSVAESKRFEELYERSRRRAFNLAYRLTGNASDAEDVTQDAYVRAWSNFETYDSARSFEGWLFRIITNRVIDMRRRQKRVPMYSLETPIAGDEDGQTIVHDFASPDGNPEETVMSGVMEEKLQKALDSLPADYRQAVIMCDIEQLSYQEIAAKMHCAIGTVRSRIHRARVMMRKQMDRGPIVTKKKSSPIGSVRVLMPLAA